MSSSRSFFPRGRPLSAPLQGAVYMIAAAFLFAVMNGAIRLLGDGTASEGAGGMHPFQIAFFRNVFALGIMLPWLARHGRVGLKTERLKTHFWRAAFGLSAMLCWFSAVAYLPLAEAVALNFTVPFFATAGAALVLGEVVRARRWTATAIGFLGVVIIVRPGFVEITPVMALPVVAAGFMAVSVLFVKSLSRSEAPATVVLYMNLLLTPLSLVPALFVWRWPTLPELGLGLFIGACAVTAHIFFTRAFARSDASAIMPFDYARLPFVAVIGFLLFDEVPDVWTWVGAAVIAGAAIYIAQREARVARERPTLRAGAESVQGRP
ncbi:DMT family transporter [Pelagibius sp. CAU 1746]|uniref:DMT family transporter n=1 Tax=Pelagibius sp. CAU 1746 TaxID=3140370 RepID=UPI00325AC3DD